LLLKALDALWIAVVATGDATGIRRHGIARRRARIDHGNASRSAGVASRSSTSAAAATSSRETAGSVASRIHFRGASRSAAPARTTAVDRHGSASATGATRRTLISSGTAGAADVHRHIPTGVEHRVARAARAGRCSGCILFAGSE
jgi:hypothetical protein